MPGTFEALFVIALAILPGGLYTWYFEREVGAWGAAASDRVVRLIGSSAIFLALYSYPAYVLWTNYLHEHEVVRGRTLYVNALDHAENLPWYLFLVPVAYVALPMVLGWLSGHAVVRTRQTSNKRWRLLATVTAGANPAPRAWDYLFLSRPAATVRIRLKSGAGWVGGEFGKGSYAAGYGFNPEDLLLEEVYEMDASGKFEVTDDGDFVRVGSAMLIRMDDVETLELFLHDT
jgi:hypothetical protein